MPRDVRPKKKRVPAVQPPPTLCTYEANAWIEGLFHEFKQNVERYNALTGQQLSLQARMELAEKTLCLTRDHLANAITQAGAARAPHDWKPLFHEVRFIGVKLVDACLTLLQEKNKQTPEELLLGLNGGMFRFRTNAPLREIHAALLRQRRVRRFGDLWVWVGDGQGETIAMRPRLAHSEPAATFRPAPTGTDEG